ncbi:MAG: permease prefix domain 1-containing protein [Candidatus Aminicenantes bacterium]
MNADADKLEARIAEWRAFVARGKALAGPDVEELESHLRDQIEALTGAGLDADEAFLVAVKRIGSLSALSREFAREHSGRLWRQLVLGVDGPGGKPPRTELIVVLALAAAAAVAVKLPELFGFGLAAETRDFYALNLGFFVLPFLTAYLAWKRGLGAAGLARLLVPFAAAALLVNLYPFRPGGYTLTLAAIHLPIALWLTVGLAYIGFRWRDPDERMNFIRFSGELFIYYVLIALGGGVLSFFTAGMFEAIDLRAEAFIVQWLLPCGAMGAVLVGSWLVEAKKSVIENMAPVLTRLFTPLFTLVLLAFLATMAGTGRGIDIQRDVLIGFDLLLAVVLGLLLYAVSARDPLAPPGFFDLLQLILVVSALVVDAVALTAIAARISDFGFTPNRTAALGENLILLVNLAWSAWLYARFLRGRAPFSALERWQTSYLPVYAAWAIIVAAVFPIVFGFK